MNFQTFLLVELILLVFYYFQALYNYYGFIDNSMSNPNAVSNSQKWHLYQAVAVCIVSGLIGFISKDFIVCLVCLVERAIFFQSFLNVIRKKGFFYISFSNDFDLFFIKLFGRYAGQMLFFGSTLFLIFLNFIEWRKNS